MKEILLYGLPPHETRDYMEVILSTRCKNKRDIALIREKAVLAGYHSFRVAIYDGQKPNFEKAIQS